MKTLDEVIKAFEMCIQNPDESGPMCPGCPYADKFGDPKCIGEDKEDALHYLKEYRDSKATIADAMERYTQAVLRHMDEADKLAAQRFVMEYDNPPLTWDELKQMEGKPVWVEALLYKQWAVIAYVGDEYIRFEGTNLYAPESRTYMGEENGWQAYRKERE